MTWRSAVGLLAALGFTEPDCAPHPLDVMAIYALYQTRFQTS